MAHGMLRGHGVGKIRIGAHPKRASWVRPAGRGLIRPTVPANHAMLPRGSHWKSTDSEPLHPHPKRDAARCGRACDRHRLAEGHGCLRPRRRRRRLLAKDGETHRVEAHPGAGVLVGPRRRALRHRRRRRPRGRHGCRRLHQDPGRDQRRLDRRARRHRGRRLRLWAGKRVIARDDKGREKILEVPSTARGLAFAPKGYRLAISHYNGATLWFPNVEAKPEVLEWKGSHLDVTWSPDARFVVTSMQENALHGWRLIPDKGHMRMSGYPSKTRSFSWSGDGKWLATSGAEAAIIWPFEVEGRPHGQGAAGMRRQASQGQPGGLPSQHLCARRRL